ncbi:MAG: hypothetical protein JETT_1656 [Candidatus Jettenia ecosi]|uniref:Uncharacterized protein n=1 Tax=Candidatus Jettenia ecosi TaxID=2494326 RepID=A0A533QBJ6_9BACT|nr:MAG: hypothetical protein JETT_1656 [Candidatus Jettenia ecosi]
MMKPNISSTEERLPRLPNGHCEGLVRSNPLQVSEEIASEKTLAMTC